MSKHSVLITFTLRKFVGPLVQLNGVTIRPAHVVQYLGLDKTILEPTYSIETTGYKQTFQSTS